MTFWQHWHLLIKKTKQIKNTHPPECASWPARSAQDDSGSSSLGSPQSGKKTRCQNHMNSKLLQHHKILFCQFNICFCFHVTCFHHFLALQLTTILQKRQLTRNYLYDNPTTTNLYLWRPSFQFVRFLWVFFFFCFLPLKKIHWDCRRLIVLMALTLARSRLLRCSWKAAGLFRAAWRGRGNRRRKKKSQD